jgi:hypothetical protein
LANSDRSFEIDQLDKKKEGRKEKYLEIMKQSKHLWKKSKFMNIQIMEDI